MKTVKTRLARIILLLIPVLCTGNPAHAIYTQIVAPGDTVSLETVDDSSFSHTNMQYVYGTTINNTVLNKAFQMIESGGVAHGTLIKTGGNQTIKEGGMASGSRVEGVLLNSGKIFDTVVNGYLQSLTGGEDHHTLIASGGAFRIGGKPGSPTRSFDAIIEKDARVDVARNAELNNWDINGTVSVYRDIYDNYSDFPIFTRAILGGSGSVYLNLGAQMVDTVMNGGQISAGSAVNELFSTVYNTTINDGQLTLRKNGIAQDTQLNGGKLINTDGQDISTVVNGGALYLTSDTAASTNLTVNERGSAYIEGGTVSDASIDGNLFLGHSGLNARLDGTVYVGNSGQLTIHHYRGVDTRDADLNLYGRVNLHSFTPGRAEFAFNDTVMNGGSFYFSNTGSRLTLASLEGHGAFLMNTDIAGQSGNFLSVTGNASGSFDIFVNDSGREPDSASSLQLVQTGGGNADFMLANAGQVVDLGVYQYYLVTDGNGGWSLSAFPPTPDTLTPEVPVIPQPPLPPTGKPSITPAASTVLSMAAVDPLIFSAELGQVQQRLNETRALPRDNNVWVRLMNTRQNAGTRAGADFRVGTSSVTVGGDHTISGENHQLTRGVFASHSASNVHFRGKGMGSGSVNASSLGVYASFRHHSGHWLDGTLKVSRFRHDMNSRMTSGGVVRGAFTTSGVGGSLATGKDISLHATTLTPYTSLTALTTNGADLSLSSGMTAHINPQRSVKGKAGILLMHAVETTPVRLKPYADIGVEQELIKNHRVVVNSSAFNNRLSGTRNHYAAGITAEISRSVSIHAQASYMKGQHLESPWNASLGVNWTF